MRPVSEIADRHRVRTYLGRGYSSFTGVYEAASEITGDKPTKILLLTDFDPSGEDMVRDLTKRMEKYGAQDFTVEKITLTKPQIHSFRLPPMMAKKSDPRYMSFTEAHGNQVVELDALPPDELEKITVEAIENYIEDEPWNDEVERMGRERNNNAR